MTTASEGGTRRMRRSEQPKVQLDIIHAWNGLCLGAFAVTYRLLGVAPDSDQHFEIVQRVAEFMLRNMRDKATGCLSTIFNIINRRHAGPLCLDYGYIILGLFNEYEGLSDASSRSTIVYTALKAHLAQRKVGERVPEGGRASRLPEDAIYIDVELCCDTVCAWHEHGFSVFPIVQQALYDSSSDHHREVVCNIAQFLREHMRDEEQHRKNMNEETYLARRVRRWKWHLSRSAYWAEIEAGINDSFAKECSAKWHLSSSAYLAEIEADINDSFAKERRIAEEVRPRKKRKLNASKKAKLTTQQVLKAIAMTGNDSTKRTIVKYIVKTYNVDNNEALKNHVIQVVDKGLKTNLIKKGSRRNRYSRFDEIPLQPDLRLMRAGKMAK